MQSAPPATAIPVSRTGGTGVPAAPASVTASVSGNNVAVSWSAVPNALYYNIFQNGTTYLTTVSQSTANWTHTGVNNGTYTYAVEAENRGPNQEIQKSSRTSSGSVTIGG